MCKQGPNYSSLLLRGLSESLQDAIRARVEDGLLTVLVPKRKQEEPGATRKNKGAKPEDQQRFRTK